MNPADRSIAIAHDQWNTQGGAERVTAEIAREFDAPIYAMYVDESAVPDDLEVIELADRRGRWFMRQHYLLQDAYQMVAWQHVEPLHEYETVIQTKTNPYWYVPRDTQTIVRYCHSTPRNLYDQYHRRGGGPIGDVVKTAQRTLYQHTIPYADQWITNSELVERRLTRYYDVGERDVTTIYPPVDVANGPDRAETEGYLFVVGRLARNKRIPLLVELAERLDRRLVVAGDGDERELVERADRDGHLEYLGFVDENEKKRRLSEAGATLMLAENEDFGIVPIESFAAGTPVIGVDEGFTRHQVRDGKNGYLAAPTVESLEAAIELLEYEGVEWSAERIATFAEQFGPRRFRREIRDVVERAREESTVEPAIDEPIPPIGATEAAIEAATDGGRDA